MEDAGETTERRKREVYANLLVDTVRRISLLPADLLERKLRHGRLDAEIKDPKARRAIFSSKPLNIVTNTWWSFSLAAVACAGMYSSAFTGVSWPMSGTTPVFTSMILLGGHRVSTEQGKGVKYRLTLVDSGNVTEGRGRFNGFGTVHDRPSGLSRCGRSQLPTLERSDSGEMNLTYPPGSDLRGIYGMFVVNAECAQGNATTSTATATAEENCGAGGGYRLEQIGFPDALGHLVLDRLPLAAIRGGSPQDAGRVGGNVSSRMMFYDIRMPWPAYCSPLGVYFWSGCLMAAMMMLKLTRRTKYANSLVVTMLWVSTGIQSLSVIGMGFEPPSDYAAADGSWSKEQSIHLRFLYIYIWQAFAFSLAPRFPDTWMGIWALAIVYVFSSESETPIFEFPLVFGPFVTVILFSMLVFGNRLKLLLVSKLQMRHYRAGFERAWTVTLSSSPDSLDQLLRLERAVGALEQSIPNGTIARQFNLKSNREGKRPPIRSYIRRSSQNNSSVSSQPNRPLLASGGSVAGSAASEQMQTPSSESSVASSRKEKRKAWTKWGSGSAVVSSIALESPSFLSCLIDADQDLVDPSAVLETGGQAGQRLIRKCGFEPVLVAASMTTSYVHDPMSPVQSMDQLWTQAMLLRGPLVSKVLGLAHRFNGLFPVKGVSGIFERPTDQTWVPSGERLKMGGVKGVERGTAKVDAAYGGDVSRLLDVCRETIVFEGIKDMADCLEELVKDPEVSVVRVKSSMTKSGHNPIVNTGLKMISLNLRIKNEQTNRLAISAHVCEVLLMLRSSAELISSKMHQKYIDHRNSMAAFHFTIIPGLTVLYEGRRLVTSAKFYFQDVVSGLKGPHIQGRRPWRVLPVRESPAISNKARAEKVSIVVQSDAGDAGLPAGDEAHDLVNQGHVENRTAEQGVGEGGASMPWAGGDDEGGKQETMENFGAVDVDIANGPIDEEVEWETCYGVTLASQDITKLECLCRFASLGLSTALDSAMSSTTQSPGLGLSSLSSIFFIADSAAIASSGFAQAICLVFGIICMAWGGGAFTLEPRAFGQGTVNTKFNASYTHFRYTSLADRIGSRFPSGPGVSAFGIVHDKEGDCRRRDAAPQILGSLSGNYDEFSRAVRVEGPQIHITFDAPVPFHGWFLKSPAGGADTSNFDVHAKSAGGDWILVGRPSWKSTSSPLVQYDLQSTAFAMPETEEMTLFEPMLRGTLQTFPSSSFGYGLGFVMFGTMGFLRFHDWAAAGMAVGFALAVFLDIVRGVERHSHQNDGKNTILLACSTARSILLLVACNFSLFRYNKVAGFLANLACCFSMAFALVMQSGKTAIGPSFWDADEYVAFCAIVWGFQVCALIGRFTSRRRALNLIKGDKCMYDQAWATLLADEAEKSSLGHMESVIKMLGLDEGLGSERTSRRAFGRANAELRQCNRKFVSVKKRKRRDRDSVETFAGSGHGDSMRSMTSVTDAANPLNIGGSRRGGDQVAGEDLMLSLFNFSSIPGPVDRSSQVISFDQLYMQAIIVNDTLRDKVKKWALESEGYLPIMPRLGDFAPSGTREFVKWKDVAGDPAAADRIKWPVLKRSRRCFEKLTRAYSYDVSRLLDISRFSLFFDRIQDLTMALGTLMSDPDVMLMRARNWLKEDWDSLNQAGYRAVHLNLRIVNRKTEMLGCETHICEVQLIMKSFGEPRTRESHQRYVKFRDLRAE